MITFLVTFADHHFDWWDFRPANGTPVVCPTCRRNTTVTKSERWSG